MCWRVKLSAPVVYGASFHYGPWDVKRGSLVPEGALTDGALSAHAAAVQRPLPVLDQARPHPFPRRCRRLESLRESLRHFWFFSIGSFITFNVIVCLPKCLQTS